MSWKALAVATSLIAAILLVVLLIRIPQSHPRDAENVVIQIRPLKELATVRYSIQRVVAIKEEKEPLGEESLLLMVQGEVEAGIDLSDLQPADVSYITRGTVSIRLPKAALLNAYLDETKTKVWDRHITWWTPWVPFDPDLEHRGRLQALADVRQAALSMGILEQARRNAEVAIRDLLAALNLKVKFNYAT